MKKTLMYIMLGAFLTIIGTTAYAAVDNTVKTEVSDRHDDKDKKKKKKKKKCEKKAACSKGEAAQKSCCSKKK